MTRPPGLPSEGTVTPVAIIYADDPARYCSGYALVATPAEMALRADLKTVLMEASKPAALQPEERDRIAAKLRASRDAAFKYDEPES